MNASWKNTREALKNFATVLICNKCQKKPLNAVRYTTCGHFFCKKCIINGSSCKICNTPTQPLEICHDHLINSLVSYCTVVAEIIQERDLWNLVTNANKRSSSIEENAEPKTKNAKLRIPKKNINKLNAKGETLLHAACIKNQEDYIKALLSSGANPNTKDHSGWTPLQEVVSFGYTGICQLLLEYGASPNTPGAGNRRPLHDAVINDRLLEAKLLLQFSANKNVYDDYGNKPIDYCKPHSEMWNILWNENELNETTEGATSLNSTLNRSHCTIPSLNSFIIYAPSLEEEHKKYLHSMVSKHNIKVISIFRPSVTHTVVEANSENIVPLSYDVMMTLLNGSWLLNTEWIRLGMDLVDIFKGDLEIFEIGGSPIRGIPKKARENAQNQNPGLFNHCHFYFALQPKGIYHVNGVNLTKDALMNLVRIGNGTVLKREPEPEEIKNNEENFIPFHVANEPNHPLYKCTHFIIYAPERDEPRMKYNMPHIKTLPLMWFIECIEKFMLVDPLQLGLLKY